MTAVQTPFRLNQESRHRVCALSTHDSLPVADHRWGTQSAKPRVPKAAPQRKQLPSHGAVTEVLERMPHTQICDLNELRQGRVARGEWALLNTLDAHVAIEEQERRRQRVQQEQQRTREALDAQMKDLDCRASEHRDSLRKEKESIDKASSQFRRDEQERQQQLRSHHCKMKEEADRQLSLFRDHRNKKLRIKIEDEQAELAETNRQLEDEQAAAEATKKRLAAEQAHLRRENDGRIAAKQAARAKENAEDARLLEETMQAAEEKDKDRQQALKDFHDMILKRGERAGQQVVQEANERAAREERLILELEERKEREARQQIKARAAVRAKLLEEVHVSRKKQIEIKEKLKVQKAEESSQHVKEVQLKDAQASHNDKLIVKAQQLAARQNQESVLQQMQEKLRRDYLEDADMTKQEKKLNAQILTAAYTTVGHPKHINIFS